MDELRRTPSPQVSRTDPLTGQQSDEPRVDAKLQERRNRIAAAFADYGKEMAFDDLLVTLDEADAYDKYVESARNLFRGLAEAAPVFINSRMEAQSGPGASAAGSGYKCIGKHNEGAIMSYFLELYDLMCDTAQAATGSAGSAVPTQLYRLEDHQSAPISGTSHKPDGVLYYPWDNLGMAAVHIGVEAKLSSAPVTTSDKGFGQIADYACAVWEKQPTRTFVPVLFLHGENAAVLVFTRSMWYSVPLGALFNRKRSGGCVEVDMVHRSMVRLWYVLTLPSDRFGHICDVYEAAGALYFSHAPGQAAATVAVSRRRGKDSMSLASPIPCPVYPRSRLAHLFDTTYGGTRAILKLSWTQHDRLPESAVYEVLAGKGVFGIPKVYDCGLLEPNVFGFKLEYLALEHCGDRPDKYLADATRHNADDREAGRRLSEVIEQVSQCLVDARVAGVLHRDLSLGNIAVADGRATVIDWGYAKIVDESPEMKRAAEKWGFDAGTVMATEANHDALTGTVLYMSVPVLMQATSRDLMDDLESLFYVALHAVSRLKNGPGSNVGEGFRFFASKNLAMVRAAALGLPGGYLGYFGIHSPHDDIRKTLDALYRFLFWSSTGYTGLQLMGSLKYEREVDLELAASFMNAKTVERLKGFLGGAEAARAFPAAPETRPAKRARSAAEVERSPL
ncbi:hypothetical protein H4R18_001413 [Coemansia javaensis]|uniref:Protein kinase domain-containing protein n=1 Tax=Coemansia javaensis TaxID=2761396 RepID=A0A9W8HLJ9_9FUNG|nr:hypothetical protein H4R18_001413 [Coemansia javaensis]